MWVDLGCGEADAHQGVGAAIVAAVLVSRPQKVCAPCRVSPIRSSWRGGSGSGEDGSRRGDRAGAVGRRAP